MPTNEQRRPRRDGAADTSLAGDGPQHSTTPLAGEALDPIKALLARLDAALAREGRIEVDGRTLLIRPIAGGYAIAGRQP